MAQFKWTRNKEVAALALAEGYTEEETAKRAGVARRTICRWKKDIDFSLEVDRLTLMTGLSQKAARLRIAMKVIRQKIKEDGTIRTGRDSLEWIKYIQSETDGAKLDLSPIFEAMEATAGSGRDEED